MQSCSSASAPGHAAAPSWENTSLSYHPAVVRLDGVNVLIIASGHGATDARISKQASSLEQLGANVTVVATLEHDCPAGLRVLAVRKPSSRLVRFLWQPWRCLRRAWGQRPHIIHLHDAEMLVALPLAKLHWRRCRVVYDVREDFANLMLIRDWLPDWLKPVVRILTNALEKGLAGFADALVSVTPPPCQKVQSQEQGCRL